MNANDFAREMRETRKERLNRPPNPDNTRRLDLIIKMETQGGYLSNSEKVELKLLQQKFGLPDQL